MRVIRASLIISAALAAVPFSGEPRAPLLIDYPEEGSVFPPDMSAPTFLWREQGEDSSSWRVEVSLTAGRFANPADVSLRSSHFGGAAGQENFPTTELASKPVAACQSASRGTGFG